MPTLNTTCELKQGSRLPSLTATLYVGDEPVDLTDADSVELVIRLKGAAEGTEVVRTCSFTDDRTSGTVTYDWDTEDTATVGVYQLEFNITFSDSRVMKCPSRGYALLKVTPDLTADD